MTPTELMRELARLDVVVTPAGDLLDIDAPRGAMTPELLDALREHKPIVTEILFRQSACRNALTPHASHARYWECNPASCYCWSMFDYPQFCQGAPCRWIWPGGVPHHE